MKATAGQSVSDTRTDLVLGLVSAALFVLAAWQTAEWSFETALFPRIVTLTGAALSLLFLVLVTVRLARRRPAPVRDAETAALLDDDEDDTEVEYVFASAGRAAWAQALAWIAVHLLLLLLGGLFLASSVFTFCYLRWAGGRTWLLSAGYAVVLTVVLYVALRVLLVVSVPEGIILGGF